MSPAGEPVLPQLGAAPSVVLVRLRSLGDTVLATPAFAMLRRAIPDAVIHVVMERKFAGVLAGNPDIDGVLEASAPAGAVAKARLVRRIRGLRPGLCIDMHGGSTAAWLTALSGARWRAGSAHFRHSWAYNARIPRAQEVLGRPPTSTVHTAEHHAAAMIHLGAPDDEIPPARLDGEPPVLGRPAYSVLHVGAAYHTKRWALERFRTVAAEIRRVHGLEAVFVAGPGDTVPEERLPGFEIRDGLSLAGLKSLLAGARIFVGNDSGPAHVAAAFGVPCVVIFGSSDSAVWHPWKTAYRVVETDWDCKPCPGDRCYAFDEPRCILSVEPAAVLRAVADLLAESGAVT